MKIAIAGYGIEGQSNYRYWASDPDNSVTIVDENKLTQDLPEGAFTIVGDNAFMHLHDFDVVVRTAGLSPDKIKTNGKIWSATNEFFLRCPAPIIGVTGTKGKGTTSSLIASIFESAGKKVWLVGNIGVAPLDSLRKIQPDDIVIYELSSFQAWDLEKSPHIAVVLPISPEHLDVHRDFDDYISAKMNIRRYQGDNDICIYNSSNEYSKKIAESSNAGGFVRYGVIDDGGVYVKDDSFYSKEQKICSTDNLQLIGQHNIDNACAAISVAKLYGLTDDNIQTGLLNFHGLPHRLEFVREHEGVKYYNDSFSSSTPATVAAIKSFNQPQIFIMGGIDRGGDFEEIANEIAKRGNVKAVIIIGEIRNKLADIIIGANPDVDMTKTDSQSMLDIVNLARSKSKQGDIIVLSPGCASFDMFKDFVDRGNQFKDVVNNL